MSLVGVYTIAKREGLSEYHLDGYALEREDLGVVRGEFDVPLIPEENVATLLADYFKHKENHL